MGFSAGKSFKTGGECSKKSSSSPKVHARNFHGWFLWVRHLRIMVSQDECVLWQSYNGKWPCCKGELKYKNSVILTSSTINYMKYFFNMCITGYPPLRWVNPLVLSTNQSSSKKPLSAPDLASSFVLHPKELTRTSPLKRRGQSF